MNNVNCLRADTGIGGRTKGERLGLLSVFLSLFCCSHFILLLPDCQVGREESAAPKEEGRWG